MRNYFIDLLTKEAESNNKIMLMVGDLGFSVTENFKEKYPKQFINAGSIVFNASRNNCDIKDVINYKCDISNEEEINNLFLNIDDLDFCINVAGTNLCETIENIDSSEWDRLFDVNLKSFYLICQKALKIMKHKGGGRIVNVSSIAGRNKSLVSGVHYTASKYGVIGLTKQLSKEVAKYNILVNCLCPSQTKTEMLEASMDKEQLSKLESSIPIKRIAYTEEQALPILFLCSEGASYITGSCIDANGGQL